MDSGRRKVVWPGKCNCIGVKIASIVETFSGSPPVTSKGSLAQLSDQAAPTFKESLLAASKAPSGTAAAYQPETNAGRRQKPGADDVKLLPKMPYIRAVLSPARSQQMVPQQVLVTQQPQLINPKLIAMRLPTGGRGASVTFSDLQSNLAQPAVAGSDSLPSTHARKESDPPQDASILPPVPQLLQNATTLSNPGANVVPNPLWTAVPTPPANAVPNADSSVVANSVPSVPVDAVQLVVPSAGQSAVPNAVHGAGLPAPPTDVPSAVPMTGASSDPSPVRSTLPAEVPSAVPSTDPSALSSPVPTTVVLSSVQEPPPSVFPTVAPGTLAKASPGTLTKGAPDAMPSAVPITLRHTIPSMADRPASPVVANVIPDASLHAVPAPVLHAAANPSASAEGVAAKASSVATSQAKPAAATPDQKGSAMGLSVPDATTAPPVTLLQPGGGLPLAAPAGASGASPAAVVRPSDTAVSNGKDGPSNPINDATGLKQQAPAASNQGGSQTDSQGTAPSGDQSQGGASQQGQDAAPAQMNFANHTIAAVTDHAQNTSVAAPLQTPPTLAGAAAHNAKTAETAPAPAVALPQAVPVINTAKLIQSMGQSEMRVGMHSNDFGNISISTSTTRDLISAQISLDHSELARTLAAHLPEMQTRLGNQAMDVRIDMNGQATGQGMGTSPGTSNGSADGSSSGRQQKGAGGSSQSDGGFAGQASAIAAAGLPPGEADARLDIRV